MSEIFSIISNSNFDFNSNCNNYNDNNMLIIREIICSNLISGFLERDSTYMIKLLQEDRNNFTSIVFYFICDILSDVIYGVIPYSLYIPFINSLNHEDIIESICLHIDTIVFNSNELFNYKTINSDIYDVSIIISFIQYEGFTKIVDVICKKKNSVDILNAIFRTSQKYTSIPKFFTKKHLIYLFEKFIQNISLDFEDIFTNVILDIYLQVDDVVKLASIYFSHHPNNIQKRFEFVKLLSNFNISEQDIHTGMSLHCNIKTGLGKNIFNYIIKNFL